MKAQSDFDDLIRSLRLFVRLRIISSRSRYNYIKLLEDDLSESTHKLHISIAYYDNRNVTVVRY